MAENEKVKYPFMAFNFAVEIKVEGVAMQVCDAAFAECDGLGDNDGCQNDPRRRK